MKSYKSEKREAQKAATRERIVAAAKAALEAEGFEKTNIRSIAAGSGVAAGTVLRHFTSKQDLCHSALFSDLDAVWMEARAASPSGSLLEDYLAVAGKFYGYYASRPVLSKELLRESMFACEPWCQRFTAQVMDVNGVLAGWAGQAMAEGRLKEDANPMLVASAFLSFYYFALIGWMQGGLPEPLPIVRMLMEQHLKGLEN